MPNDACCGESWMGLVRDAPGPESSVVGSSALAWVWPATIDLPTVVS